MHTSNQQCTFCCALTQLRATARVCLQTKKVVKRTEAMHCFWALQEAVCCSCGEMLSRVMAGSIDVVALQRLNTWMSAPHTRFQQHSTRAHQRQDVAMTSAEQRLQVRTRISLCAIVRRLRCLHARMTPDLRCLRQSLSATL